MTVDSRPSRVDLNIYAGDDVAVRINVKNPGGTPADLTGAVATAQIRASHTADVALADFDTVVDPSGVVMISLDAATTAALPGWAVWDCQIVAPAGQVTTIAAGSIRTAQEVTR